jgi:sarcosine oxidase delta subunit
MMVKCPWCGSTEHIESNGAKGRDKTLLCTRPCEPEESSFDDLHDDEDRRICGYQWNPSEENDG